MNYYCHLLKALYKNWSSVAEEGAPGSAWIRSEHQPGRSLTANLRACTANPPLSPWLHLKKQQTKGQSSRVQGWGLLWAGTLGAAGAFFGDGSRVGRAVRSPAPTAQQLQGQAWERWAALICCDEWSSGSLLLEGKKYILCHNWIWFLFTNKFLDCV